MKRARPITYEQIRGEKLSYTQARRSQFAFKTVATKSTSDPMDVKKGSKRGGNCQNLSQNPCAQNVVVCWHCGKKGHLSTECWSAPKNQSGSRGGQPRQLRSSSANSQDLASCEKPSRSPHLDAEVWLRWTYDTGAAISSFPLDAGFAWMQRWA